jgi:hypothetical protein
MFIGVFNMTFRPLRTLALGLLEYLSVSLLAFPVALGLFFVNAPVVEPKILIDGDHSQERFGQVTVQVLLGRLG